MEALRVRCRWLPTQMLEAVGLELGLKARHGEGRRVLSHRTIWKKYGSANEVGLGKEGSRFQARPQLLSPHRGRQGAAKTHDGRVITQAPNVMLRVFTLDESSRQSNTGTRSAWGGTCAKSEAASRHSIRLRKGSNVSMDADVARGLALRMDHGSQYLSDHFLKQIRYWGITPASALSRNRKRTGWQRWNRTLKEQAIHGRIFQNLAAVRAAVADFVERYNQTWRLEKLGYHTPIEAREEYELRQAA